MTEPSAIRYRVAAKDPAAHLFEVTCEVPDPDPEGQTVSLAAWIPGSYVLRDFARHVVTLHARAGEGPLRAAKLDKQTWRCDPCPGPLTVEYQIYARDPSIRAAYLDTERGFFNGTSVFVKVEGRETRPCVVDIEPPPHPDGRDWRVATAMQAHGAAPWSFGSYRASGYEELIDHPVEMGSFDVVTFDACGVDHDVVVSGRHHADLARIRDDLQTLCRHHIRFFGEPAPMRRYVFLVRAVGEGYGGLEHRASCALLCPRKSLVRGTDPAPGKDYRGFLGLCSHEYFHAWNVKRIRPRAFVPLDLSREVHTTLLWVFEGITSYYDDLALVRTGLVDAPSYLELLAQTATRVWRNPGRRRQSVAESSFDAWTKFYRQDENAPNAVVSYYAKGALVGLALDLSIRRDSGGRYSLDHVMRALWARYGEESEGLPEAGMAALIAETTGLDLGPLLEDAVNGTADLPLNDLLADFGVAFELRAAQSQEDKGGPLPADAPPAPTRGVLGVILGGTANEARVVSVLDGGAAQAAGLAPDDVVAAVDGIRATRSNLEELVGSYTPGARVPVHVFRGDELMCFDLAITAAPRDTVVLKAMEEVDAEVAARRDAWLQGP